MKYLLLLTLAPGAGPREGTPELDAEMKRWGALNDEMKQAGAYWSPPGCSSRTPPRRCARTAAIRY